jgi:Cu/Ag efflux pump CusA
MLGHLVRAALTQRVLVLSPWPRCSVVLGLRATGDVPLDVFPEFAPPMVEVQTEAPGMSTEEVESLVTVPIEVAVKRRSRSGDAALEIGAGAFVGPRFCSSLAPM